jgi:hypothetical protein
MFEGNIYSIRKKNKGSFVKCVDTSRTDLTEKQISPLNKNIAKTVKLLILLSSSDTGNLFVIIL